MIHKLLDLPMVGRPTIPISMVLCRPKPKGIDLQMRVWAARLGCLAAMIIFIVLLGVPTQARAHAGHSHEASSVVASSTDVDLDANAAIQPVPEEALLFARDGNDATPAKCLGGCCTGASHACCAFVAPGRLDEGAPSFVHQRVHEAPSFALLDHLPSAPGKPPRTFA